jgi:outer membrane putative beta-barrel porin/alpha-amylase
MSFGRIPATARTKSIAASRSCSRCFVIGVLLIVAGSNAYGDLAMETETARVLEPGHIEVGTAFEFQTSPAGEEYALPMAIEFGVFPHLEALIEPVPFTSIRPKGETAATGVGDLETTLTYLVVEEKQYIPALALAGEIKFPTAGNRQIGSGEYDYRVYAIASKRFGPVDVHANFGYNITGSPPGVSTRNPIDVEAGAEWFVHPKFDLFGEINYVGSSAGSESSAEAGVPVAGESTVTPEIAVEELVGSVGVRAHVARHVDVFGSFSYDNNDAKLFRTGVTIKY